MTDLCLLKSTVNRLLFTSIRLSEAPKTALRVFLPGGTYNALQRRFRSDKKWRKNANPIIVMSGALLPP